MKRKFLDKLMRFIPKAVRHSLYRHRAKVPPFALATGFSVEIASTREDLECAYKILHDSYVATKLMAPNASGLRCNIFSFLPNTTVIVAKFDGQVVGTVSLVRDSRWGLPSDNDYRIENGNLRNQGRTLVEVSALAVARQFRHRGNAVSLLLMKYLYNYTRQYLSGNCLVCTVHPRAEDFYQALWLFKRNGEVVEYGFADGALAVHLSLDVSPGTDHRVVVAYPSLSKTRNLGLFVLEEDKRFKYPARKAGAHIDPIYTNELFNYFCVEKTKVWSTLSKERQVDLADIYGDLRIYRIPVELRAMVCDGPRKVIVKLSDLSTAGAFLIWPRELRDPSKTIMLSVQIGDSTYTLSCRIAWKSRRGGQPHGFGIEFLEDGAISSQQLRKWMNGDLPPSQDLGLRCVA